MTLFYRFRRIENLLGEYKELERQSIYFASPEQLNDPMEGYRDLIWTGDRVAWRNLFRHYLLCLERAFLLLILAGERHFNIREDLSSVYVGIDWFPTQRYRERFQRILRDFFAKRVVATMIDGIIRTRRIARRDELRFYLYVAHVHALHSIQDISQEAGLIPITSKDERADLRHHEFAEFFNALAELEHDDHKTLELLFRSQANVANTLALRALLDSNLSQESGNRDFVIRDFPDVYLRSIERLVYPDWYTACFMKNCSNSSVWGNYAAGHSGVCLIFESSNTDGTDYLPLHGYVGISTGGLIRGTLPLPFRAVQYGQASTQIDFFRSIGRTNARDLQKTWYTDESGDVSECAHDLQQDETRWREAYWSRFLEDLLRKTKDWDYEQEYRLVLYSHIIDYASYPGHRSLTYDFASLKGLIFGIKTRTEDKLQIIRILNKKCAEHGRTDFNFYQAEYSAKDGCIAHIPLNI
jgi:hypothetical protein